MARLKTLLTPEDQWVRTAAYCTRWGRPVVADRACWVGIFHGTHHLAKDGDVLVITSSNGMVKRFGMTGITSTGARLANYHLPLRRGFTEVLLPGDFMGMPWNDPDMGRYVADLRASFRGRVSAYSPATSHCKTGPGVDTEALACFGLYKSGRLSGEGYVRRLRHYLRFYPNGSVTWTLEPNHQGWSISFEPDLPAPAHGHARPLGTIRAEAGAVSFDLFDRGQFFARYQGHLAHGRLWLACESPRPHVSHGKLPYRFHPFNRAAY